MHNKAKKPNQKKNRILFRGVFERARGKKPYGFRSHSLNVCMPLFLFIVCAKLHLIFTFLFKHTHTGERTNARARAPIHFDDMRDI